MKKPAWNECKVCQQLVAIVKKEGADGRCHGCDTSYRAVELKRGITIRANPGQKRDTPKVGDTVYARRGSGVELVESVGLDAGEPMEVVRRSAAYDLGMVLFCKHPSRIGGQLMLWEWQVSTDKAREVAA